MLQNLPIAKNGFLYVYVSNATPNIDVFFDNLQVTHIKGPLLEENHYYPYGLAMAGISSRALPQVGNNYKANAGTELGCGEWADGSGLELYETDLRLYDAQIGRFTGVDILAESGIDVTPYHFAANNPVLFVDPTGAQYSYMDSHGDKWHHADPLSGTLGAGQAYQEGFGIDGFGGIPGGGSVYSGNGHGLVDFYKSLWNKVGPNDVGNFSNFSSRTGSFKGNSGTWLNYSYWIDNGYSTNYKDATLDNYVMDNYFIQDSKDQTHGGIGVGDVVGAGFDLWDWQVNGNLTNGLYRNAAGKIRSFENLKYFKPGIPIKAQPNLSRSFTWYRSLGNTLGTVTRVLPILQLAYSEISYSLGEKTNADIDERNFTRLTTGFSCMGPVGWGMAMFLQINQYIPVQYSTPAYPERTKENWNSWVK